MANVDLTHIPYKGAGPMMQDLLAGQVDMAFDGMSTSAPQIRGGRLKPLAVTTTGRSFVVPNVPTMQEAGLTGYLCTTWYALWALKGTPKEALERLYVETAKALQAPVQLTINAKGLLPAEHPLLAGSIQSTPAGRALAAEADVVLAVGTELGETDYDTVFDGGFRLGGTLIRVDIDPAQIGRNFKAGIGIVADAALALASLHSALPAPARAPAWGAERTRAAREAAWRDFDAPTRSLAALVELVAQTLPGAIFMGDSTQTVYAGNLSFNPDAPRRWFNASTGYGTLGYGLPAALGAQLAAPGQPVVALVGDGGLLFTIAELASAVEAQLPVVVLLWNNQGYGEIKKYMLRHAVATIGVDLYTPDFVAIASGFGCHAERAADPAQLRAALLASRGRRVPSLIEIDEAAWFQATVA